MKATAQANTNIALIKYWGKRDESKILPMNSSLSLTLNKFYTTTTVEFCTCLSVDVFIINNQLANEFEMSKVTRFLDRIREMSGKDFHAVVNSTNHVPTAAGFASSASGYAALAAAATKAIGLNLDQKALSQLARLGSGSACRSIYGGFVEWQKGIEDDGTDSFAQPLKGGQDWDLSVLSVLLTSKPKEISSSEGMKRAVETSSLYSHWLDTVEKDLLVAKEAIKNRDFDMLGSVVEANALKMHATTFASQPPFSYWNSATVEVIRGVKNLRSSGIQAYFTIDAGPNVKVLCQPKDEQVVREALIRIPGVQEIYHCQPGPGISYLSNSGKREIANIQSFRNRKVAK
ncbi:diphosphomevalonate decarboxylase [Neobacillus sp. MM2021_6]|uniref:diphosphomevalonate decarboxylase n=1 Tax=Bacillaceae TaxID=186817 RepID=UPI0014099B0C|nr:MULTISPECIES: diphosphomevalonate decarboxylase [Bacillaceae]MBO0961399.1 diphosphomevalonate decarboxylase [Neobacillus sp. MM2021_6]NHC20440.1 diphosphomevalonate decarboxylase [Bacillus sp. MM2020_4]